MVLNGIYAFVLIALTLSNIIGPERTWLGSFNLYLPQWLWALPGMPLLLLTLAFAPRRIWLPMVCLLWVFGPIMGLCWHPAHTAAGKGIHLRVMTYNVKWGRVDADAIVRDVLAFHPDLLQMQDAAGIELGPLGKALTGWTIRLSGQFVVASRLPFTELETRWVNYLGEHHHCVRSTLTVDGTPITIYDIHLLTPREGLQAVRYRQIAGMEENTQARLGQARELASYIRQETGPLILTGDLNAPVQSEVCKTLFAAGLRDAFSEAGRGYGYTYGQSTRVHMPYVRIDHIMVNAPWQVENCQVGNDRGSEHCPVIADLFLKNSGQ